MSARPYKDAFIIERLAPMIADGWSEVEIARWFARCAYAKAMADMFPLLRVVRGLAALKGFRNGDLSHMTEHEIVERIVPLVDEAYKAWSSHVAQSVGPRL